jgi:hypothetical protein
MEILHISRGSDYHIIEYLLMIVGRENQNIQLKTYTSFTLSTRNPTRISLELNSGLHGKRPTCLSYDKAMFWCC